MNELQTKLLDFLATCNTCVLATAGDGGRPEAATVGFSNTQQLELTIGTSNKSRKFQNISKEPHVAVVFGFVGDITVQLEGTARVLVGNELEVRKETHFQKLPIVRKYESDLDQTYISVKPEWVRLTDYTQQNPIQELRSFE